jgi:5-(carboxyamino)imidazole ribonucleotide mutase
MPGGVPVATVALNGAKMPEFLPHHWSHDQCVLDKIIFYKEGLNKLLIKHLN